MTCYRISHGNDSIAIVTSLGMARAITLCQPPGYYRVCEMEVDLDIVERQSPGRRQGIRPPVSHRGRKPGERSGRKIFFRLQGAQRPRVRLRLSKLQRPASALRTSPPRT